MEPSQTFLCSFCGLPNPPSPHDCAEKVFTLLNTLAGGKHEATLFSNIDNLIFQGGGVKGIGYLGVLEELTKPENNPEILKNAKRIAGTSAGALLALYLGLNMTQEEIGILLSRSYEELLDEDVVLKVCTNPTKILPGDSWLSSWEYAYSTSKQVFLDALALFNGILAKLKDPQTFDQAKEDLTNIFSDILKYYSYYQGTLYKGFIGVSGDIFAKYITNWIVGALAPETDTKLEVALNTDSFKQPTLAKSLAPAVQSKVFNWSFENIIDETFVQAQEKVKQEEQERKKVGENQPAAPKAFNLTAPKKIISTENATAPTDNTVPTDTDDIKTEEEHYDFYKKTQKSKPQTRKAKTLAAEPLLFAAPPTSEPKPKLTKLAGSDLNYGIAELFYVIIMTQKKNDKDVGLFSGDLVKQEIIEKPIKDKFSKFFEKEDPTFQDLANCFLDNEKKIPAFKDFYVLGFNTATLRTEVFSAEHTPNVVVADAVRASMSIPIFFRPVNIREENTPSGYREIYYKNGLELAHEPIHYMDGGVFDNYAIWLFDDLKYCLKDTLNANWNPEQKFMIHNPRTLGFKLLGQDRIDIYVNPYFDNDPQKMKRITAENFNGSFFSVLGTLSTAELNEHEESNFINQANYRRTGYVDNLGISAIAFNLTLTQKNGLIEQGRQAVREYKDRAKSTRFIGEGQKYL